MSGLNLREETNASIAEVKQGDVCGDRLLWSNLVAPSNSTWRNIDKQIRDSLAPYNMFDKFKEGDGLHDLASIGNNSSRVTGKGQVLTVEGWRFLFHELFQECSDLAKSPKGGKLRIFGLRLAMTSPQIIFEGANWVKQDGETLGLQSGLLTDAWMGAYIYFGAHWKQEDSFRDYLAPPGKPKAKPFLEPHSFFDVGQV
jgi:hypothetical protein